MIRPNDRIAVTATPNGFVVRKTAPWYWPFRGDREAIVFESFTGFIGFLNQHFTHRSQLDQRALAQPQPPKQNPAAGGEKR